MLRKPRPNNRAFAMMVAVGMMGLVTVAIVAASGMFSNQARRTRTVQQEAQQRQIEIATVLLQNENDNTFRSNLGQGQK
ncbi:hypothetical protein JYU15_00240 [bacterium AH-315-I18]|nr:hypothetical protein [Phycisphaeraceae bacterium]MBN4060841.1 hypothetical protein [bacterium AH-315-I18]